MRPPDACLDGVNQGLSGRQRSSRAADERITGPGRVDLLSRSASLPERA